MVTISGVGAWVAISCVHSNRAWGMEAEPGCSTSSCESALVGPVCLSVDSWIAVTSLVEITSGEELHLTSRPPGRRKSPDSCAPFSSADAHCPGAAREITSAEV